MRYADRSSADASFSSSRIIPESDEYFAQVTLSPDGLQLIGVRLDGAGFGVLQRAARGEAFQAMPDETPFESLYGAPAANLSNGPFADPVITLTPSLAGSELKLTWPSEAGYQYQLRSSTNLQDWIDRGESQAGTGGELSATVPTAGQGGGFLRVRAAPVP